MLLLKIVNVKFEDVLVRNIILVNFVKAIIIAFTVLPDVTMMAETAKQYPMIIQIFESISVVTLIMMNFTKEWSIDALRTLLRIFVLLGIVGVVGAGISGNITAVYFVQLSVIGIAFTATLQLRSDMTEFLVKERGVSMRDHNVMVNNAYTTGSVIGIAIAIPLIPMLSSLHMLVISTLCMSAIFLFEDRITFSHLKDWKK